MNGEESSVGLSMSALLLRKFVANSIPRQLSFQADCNFSSERPPTIRKRDWPEAKAIMFLRCKPRSKSKPVLAHCCWNAWKVASELRHLAVIWASAKSE